MLSEAMYNEELLSRVERRAMGADYKIDEGFIDLRKALIDLLSIDAHSFKQQGTSRKQRRLLPDIKELFSHPGICLFHRNDINLSPCRKADVGRADSSHLLREISYAMVDGEHYWGYFNGQQVLRVRRLLYVGDRESLTEKTRRYLEKRNAFVDEHYIATIDVVFTASALKWFVLKICESYRSCM